MEATLVNTVEAMDTTTVAIRKKTPTRLKGNRERLFELIRYKHHPEKTRRRNVARAFYRIAKLINSKLEPSAERTAALRHLTEAKDCAVRACVPPIPADFDIDEDLETDAECLDDESNDVV